MRALLTSRKKPNKLFRQIVTSIVDEFIDSYTNHPHPEHLYVMGLLTDDGRVHYYGFLDISTMPEEDIYLEMMRRFLAGVLILGEEHVTSFGIVNIWYVQQNMPINAPAY